MHLIVFTILSILAFVSSSYDMDSLCYVHLLNDDELIRDLQTIVGMPASLISNSSADSNMDNALLRLTKLESIKDSIYGQQFSFQWPQYRKRRDVSSVEFNDPMWAEQWYMNSKTEQGRLMDFEGAWAQGLSGRDDGLEYTHPEIWRNYDQKASYDFNDNDDDPFPRLTLDEINRHGTRCAGQIVCHANNSFCCVGIARNARIGGIKVLDGRMNDVSEMKAFNFRNDHIDIYSASWGPTDNGETLDGPGILATSAIANSSYFGRGGLGSVFVWAAGNGGRFKDDCNCDGYANSPYTIAINSVSSSFKIPIYSESCSAALTSTFSSGNPFEDKRIYSADLRHKCTNSHTGTSASAPMVAGCVALALEANPNLTARDIQHLIVQSSSRGPLEPDNWRKNGAGLEFGDHFGFGLLNVNTFVTKAKNWTRTAEKHLCAILPQLEHVRIPPNEAAVAQITTTSCNAIRKLEYVETVLTIDSRRRGKINITLTSPMGTKSNLLKQRPYDLSTSGFYQWSFVSANFWGEDPKGKWTLKISNNDCREAHFTQWLSVFHGTS